AAPACSGNGTTARLGFRPPPLTAVATAVCRSPSARCTSVLQQVGARLAKAPKDVRADALGWNVPKVWTDPGEAKPEWLKHAELIVEKKSGKVRQAGASEAEGKFVRLFKRRCERNLFTFLD